jgi:hypothetical protein
MIFRLTLISLLFWSSFSMSQTCFDKIAHQRIRVDLSKPIDPENQPIFRQDLFCFLERGFDSIDIELLLSSDFFGIIFIESLNTIDEGITYTNLYETFKYYKNRYDYEYTLAQFQVNRALQNLRGTYSNWGTFIEEYQKLYYIELDDDFFDPFKRFLETHSDSTISMLEMLDRFDEFEAELNIRKVETDALFDRLFAPTKIDIEPLLQESIDQNKPILLYFTGFSVVGSSKLESTIMRDPKILDALNSKFIFRALYVDDRSLLPESEWVNHENHPKTVKTIGDVNQFFEMDVFNIASVPFFAAINQESEIIDSAVYGDFRTPEEFIEFLDDIILSFGE